ncbi:MAG TPA: hypothetical protein VFV99_01300, partial [Kofleriaceae bacterium]|nr:hypothetical protein [Kofleriaceae bacterium]
MRWCLLLYAMTACMRVESTPGGGTEHQITLTIDRRATVGDVSSLLISISSAGTTTTDTVVASEFPLFHTVTADGLIGRVDIGVDALDDAGHLVGRGEATTDANAGRASVMMQGADFLLNSSYTGDQLLTNDFDAAGVQLAATSAGAWTVAFRDECTSCGIYARRFDASGFPLASGSSGSTAQLTMSSVPTRPDANPAVAAGATDTLVVWDFTDLSTPDTQGVACHPLDAEGSEPAPGQQTIASEISDVVTAVALASGDFVVTWNGFMTTSTIRSMIVRPDCSAVTSPTTISTPAGVKGPYRA